MLTPGVVHSIVVPMDQAAHVGLAADQVKIRKEYGEGFPANVEGLHQLHCLVSAPTLAVRIDALFDDCGQNLVRQSLFYNYDYYHSKGEGAFQNNDYILQKHVCKWPPPPLDSRQTFVASADR